MCSLITCAKCCTIFSVTGFVFLIIMGILLQKQPLYIKGPTDPDAAAAGCYQGAAIYVATFVLSLLYWIFDDMKNGRGMFCRRRAARPANSSLDQARYGGKYGAVKTDI